MNYFMTDIHGASKAYFEMIDRLNIKNNDELYILGDILMVIPRIQKHVLIFWQILWRTKIII